MFRLPVILVVCVPVCLCAAGSARAWRRAAWIRPVDGPVVATFHYTRARAFAAGARRGVDFAAPSGAAVRAPCSGRVRHAGPIPRWGAGVTLRCGPLVATVLRLSALAVRAGAWVSAGDRLGFADAGGWIRLGARRAGDRFAYLDPVGLLGPAGRAPPAVPRLGPVPRPGAPPPLAARRPVAVRVPRPGAAWRPRGAAAPRGAPLVAWLGVGLLAASFTAGGSLRVVRRRWSGGRTTCPHTRARLAGTPRG